MKKKFLYLIILAVTAAFMLSSCAGVPDGDGKLSPSLPESYNGDSSDNGTPAPGQLTAAEWSDLKNYDYWLGLLSQGGGGAEKGVFYNYNGQWGLNSLYMVPVNVSFNKNPVSDAVVKLYGAGEDVLFTARTNSRGEAFLFSPLPIQEGHVRASYGANTKTKAFEYSSLMSPVKIELDGAEAKEPMLEIMFVIDTTGSMGDEIKYLKSEIKDVIEKVSADANLVVSLALLLYRDLGDNYITQYYGFTNDISAQTAVLGTVSADGGGDFPEAVDIALSEATEKEWSTDRNITRLIIHVLDAPPHDGQSNKELYAASIFKAAEMGIRIIPVASSGVDKLTEYLLRSEALFTGGTYVFLTGDSGIGYEHIPPSVKEFVVEYLNALLMRVIKEYCTGKSTAPVPYKSSSGQGN